MRGAHIAAVVVCLAALAGSNTALAQPEVGLTVGGGHGFEPDDPVAFAGGIRGDYGMPIGELILAPGLDLDYGRLRTDTYGRNQLTVMPSLRMIVPAGRVRAYVQVGFGHGQLDVRWRNEPDDAWVVDNGLSTWRAWRVSGGIDYRVDRRLWVGGHTLLEGVPAGEGSDRVRAIGIGAALTLVPLAPTAAPARSAGQMFDGLTLGFTVGAGTLRPPAECGGYCTSVSVFAAEVSAGWLLRPELATSIDVGLAWAGVTDYQGFAGLGVKYWVGRAWGKVGLGYSDQEHHNADGGPGGSAGVAGTLSLGYDLARARGRAVYLLARYAHAEHTWGSSRTLIAGLGVALR